MIVVLIKNYTESSQVIFILTALNHTEVQRVLVCSFLPKCPKFSYNFSHRPIKRLKSGIGINSCAFFFLDKKWHLLIARKNVSIKILQVSSIEISLILLCRESSYHAVTPNVLSPNREHLVCHI